MRHFLRCCTKIREYRRLLQLLLLCSFAFFPFSIPHGPIISLQKVIGKFSSSSAKPCESPRAPNSSDAHYMADPRGGSGNGGWVGDGSPVAKFAWCQVLTAALGQPPSGLAMRRECVYTLRIHSNLQSEVAWLKYRRTTLVRTKPPLPCQLVLHTQLLPSLKIRKKKIILKAGKPLFF